MRFDLSKRGTRALIASIMLFAFVVRALVPQGFMPATSGSFSIEICPDGFPAQLLAHTGHHHHPGTHSNSEHCVFGSASASGPASHLASLTFISLAQRTPVMRFESAAIPVQLVHLPHARGPPPTAA
jgi:hypothetical protein